jgi:predicted transcriptional regulator
MDTVVHIKFSAEELGALDRLAADDERSRHFVVRRIVRQNLEFSGYLKGGDAQKQSGTASDKRPAHDRIESGANRDESGTAAGISGGVVSESMRDTGRGRRAAEPLGELKLCKHRLYACERCHG